MSYIKVFRHHSSNILRKKMSTFVQKLNPLTGKTIWEMEDENYDYHQEIARSMYADMLHDTDRNQKYYKALKSIIDKKHAQGQKANVLDIGTGTGLLSMMAAKCNADSIVACEAFPPIAAIARRVIADNNLSDKIKVVAKRSTELEVGPDKDMEYRANILVTEVFDTELIGEGAVETFNHAKTYLLEPNATVIPEKGRVYAAVVESDFLSSCNKFNSSYPLPDGGEILMPEDIINCPGTNGVHDIQLSQLPTDGFKMLTQPLNIVTFDFGGEMLLAYDDNNLSEVTAVADGEAQVVLMWWELDMDSEDTVITCAPSWYEPSAPWRDHWMQAVYHLPKRFHVKEGQKFALLSSHDEFSFWFNIYSDLSEGMKYKGNVQAPICTCGAHVITSRTRISEMNSAERWKVLRSMSPPKGGVCLFLGDFSLVPLAIAKQSAKKVYCIEENPTALKIWSKIIEYNQLTDQIIVLSEYNRDLISEKIDYVLSEPYFRKSIYPWDNMRCAFAWESLAPDANLYFPHCLRIVTVAMSFNDLHKIKVPLGNVEAFDLTSFDHLIKGSSEKSESDVETQPLWEYPGIALSGPAVIYELMPKVGNIDKKLYSDGSFNIKRSGECHGLAIWVDYFGSDVVLSGAGPKEYIVPGKTVRWDRTARQGVYLFRTPLTLEEGQAMEFSFELAPSEGNIEFRFQPKPYT
ncbi:unnamed protein product [Nezara viridula]|uniref:Protein arginine N-methyltransferase n=1 Tax=Nezara viridula TaxID=85310 RepID=A0A9P0HB07_NEZVI|nr:unnamed protein product [Nezara viridula]